MTIRLPVAVPAVDQTAIRGAQTAGRAIEVLRLVVDSDRPVGLTEVAQRAGINKSAANRLLRELEQQALLAREPEGRRYVVGSGLVALSAMVMSKVSIRDLAHPVMVRIAESTDETVSLHVRHQGLRVLIDGIESQQSVRRSAPLGETLPLYSGPSGKAILAFLPESEITALLEGASSEGLDAPAIRKQLELLRRDGYLATVADRNPGVGGLSAPIFGPFGVLASLTVSGPSERWSQKAMRAAVPGIKQSCAELSRLLGHLPDVRDALSA